MGSDFLKRYELSTQNGGSSQKSFGGALEIEINKRLAFIIYDIYLRERQISEKHLWDQSFIYLAYIIFLIFRKILFHWNLRFATLYDYWQLNHYL